MDKSVQPWAISEVRPWPHGLRRTVTLLVTGLVLLAAACTSQPGHPTAGFTAGPTSAGQAPDSPSHSGATAGTAPQRETPLVDTCHRAREITTRFPTPADVVLGPLSYAGFRNYRSHPIQDPNWGTGYFYKSGAQLRPGVSVTVSIMNPATKYAAIITESRPDRGSEAVTYRSCGRTGPTGYWWVGGFVPWGRRTACVPVRVTSPSEPTEHRAVISVGAGDCK